MSPISASSVMPVAAEATIIRTPNSEATTMTKPIATRKRKRAKLGFDEIEIIELPVGLGDNPGGLDGPPVSCCFYEPQLRIKVCLEVFEGQRPQRRTRKQLRLSKRLREKLLLKHGYSQDDITRATFEARKARFDRVLSSTTAYYPPKSGSTSSVSTTSAAAAESGSSCCFSTPPLPRPPKGFVFANSAHLTRGTSFFGDPAPPPEESAAAPPLPSGPSSPQAVPPTSES